MLERLLQSLLELIAEIWDAESQVHSTYDNVIINLDATYKLSNNCALNFEPVSAYRFSSAKK